MKTEKGKTFLTAFQNTLPIMAGGLVLGAGFGILLKTKGCGVVRAFLMSVFIYAGSMQYVAIDLFNGKRQASFLRDFHAG